MQNLDFTQKTPYELVEIGSTSLKSQIEANSQLNNISFSETYMRETSGLRELDISASIDQKNLKIIKLIPINERTHVFGLDTSSIELGETNNGLICAVRGTIVWKDKTKYNYSRYGPFIFHITEDNKQFLYNKLRCMYFGLNETAPTPEVWWMPGRIRNIFERWLQSQLSSSCNESIILWDGALNSGTVDGAAVIMDKMLQTARDRGNVVLSLSKKTKFLISGRKIIDLIKYSDAPCLLDLDKKICHQHGKYIHFFGRVYAAKFTPDQLTFRLDIDRGVKREKGVKAVQKLIGNDVIVNSYPETLRLAHVLSRFSASEIIAMQRFIAEKFGIKTIIRPNVRQILFGPYGGGKRNFGGGL